MIMVKGDRRVMHHDIESIVVFVVVRVQVDGLSP